MAMATHMLAAVQYVVVTHADCSGPEIRAVISDQTSQREHHQTRRKKLSMQQYWCFGGRSQMWHQT